jgi:glycosyltransferase involved in cell wall biosynthesis
MKLLIYAHAFAPMIGGIETYTMLLAQGVANKSRTGPVSAEVTVVTQATVNRMDDSKLPFRVIRRPGAAHLAWLVHEADVIHIANPAFLPMLFAWLLRKPAVVEHDGYQSACPNGLLFHGPTKTDCPGYFLARRYQECLRCNCENAGKWRSLRMLLLTFPRRWLCSKMTVNIGASHHVGRRVEMPRTEVIYHGIPFPAVATPSGARTESSVTCFAYVGRMVQEKGVPVLLLAANELAKRGYEFRLKLIGDGPVRAELERMTDELGLRDRTFFTGFLQGDALQDAMREATAAVMPSIWEDVAPLASVEHMMNGRLLIASDLGGLGELVDGVGLKFPVGDSTALADCLLQVIKNPELVRKLGEDARTRARELFTQDRMVRDHLDVYARIATVKSNREETSRAGKSPEVQS